MRFGRVAVIDEADKAPIEVVCVLKSLLEDGQMRLSDGRRILCPEKFLQVASSTTAEDSDIIWIHPEFKLIALANRPGFPFLGNDFFGKFAVYVFCWLAEVLPTKNNFILFFSRSSLGQASVVTSSVVMRCTIRTQDLSCTC